MYIITTIIIITRVIMMMMMKEKTTTTMMKMMIYQNSGHSCLAIIKVIMQFYFLTLVCLFSVSVKWFWSMLIQANIVGKKWIWKSEERKLVFYSILNTFSHLAGWFRFIFGVLLFGLSLGLGFSFFWLLLIWFSLTKTPSVFGCSISKMDAAE